MSSDLLIVKVYIRRYQGETSLKQHIAIEPAIFVSSVYFLPLLVFLNVTCCYVRVYIVLGNMVTRGGRVKRWCWVNFQCRVGVVGWCGGAG